jgi:hypothetical protein
LTPQELREARRRAAAERAAEEERMTEERVARQQREAERGAWVRQARRRHEQLKSVVDLLYDELDKLNKKWPSIAVSPRQLERVNKAIAGVRDLLKNDGDEFVEDIHEFVAAGDMPENRDAVMALRELKGALSRFHTRHHLEYTTTEMLAERVRRPGETDDEDEDD